MYAQFFGLRELPFNNTPDPRFFYSTPDHEEALALLVYAVSERKEFAVLTGEIGAGKTLVSRMMLRHFGSRIVHAVVNHAVRSGTELLEVVCTELGLEPGPGVSQASLTRTLHDFLLQQFSRNTPVVLLLDEAQNLPVEAFEQLRMIGNLESDDAKLLQTIIVGQPELRKVIACPALRQLAQRVFRSFHLPALNRTQTEAYIRHRLKVAGNETADLIDVTAIDVIHVNSDGLPRVINTLCDNVMLSAFSANKRRIERAFAEMVIGQTRILRGEPGDIRGFRQAHPPGGWVARRTDTPTNPVEIPSGDSHTQPPFAPNPSVLSSAAGHGHMRAVVDEVLRRLDGLETQVSRAASSMADDRLRQVESATVVAQAKSLVTRVDAACRELRQRELSIDRLTSTGRSILDEMTRVVSDVRKSAALLDQKQRSAGAIADHLSERIHHARELAHRSSTSEAGVGGLANHGRRPPDANISARSVPSDNLSVEWKDSAKSAPPDERADLTRSRLEPGAVIVLSQAIEPERDRISSHEIKEGNRRGIEFNPKSDLSASQRLAANVDELLRFVETASRPGA